MTLRDRWRDGLSFGRLRVNVRCGLILGVIEFSTELISNIKRCLRERLLPRKVSVLRVGVIHQIVVQTVDAFRQHTNAPREARDGSLRRWVGQVREAELFSKVANMNRMNCDAADVAA